MEDSQPLLASLRISRLQSYYASMSLENINESVGSLARPELFGHGFSRRRRLDLVNSPACRAPFLDPPVYNFFGVPYHNNNITCHSSLCFSERTLSTLRQNSNFGTCSCL
eukprot:scaffold132_cov170-Amphora_coffeaeformis.AAC.29